MVQVVEGTEGKEVVDLGERNVWWVEDVVGEI
jgi:hypothetical protein